MSNTAPAEKFPMKTIGRKGRPQVGLENMDGLLRLARDLRPPLDVIPGVYKFHTHDEAEEWMTKAMARSAARAHRRQKT